MKTFTLFWGTGDAEIVTGRTISEAMNNAGYGGGALGALQFYATGDARGTHAWDAKAHRWIEVAS